CSYRSQPSTFDVVIIMSQGVGYFDANTNRDVLHCLASGLRQGGRLILDLWNPEFFVAHQGDRELETDSGTVRETKRVDGDRLFVSLVYPDGASERFEWQLFSPKQMDSMAESAGLMLSLTCTDFDEAVSASPISPRVQFLFERRDAAPATIVHP